MIWSKVIVLYSILTLIEACPPSNITPLAVKDVNYRLPKAIKPIRYRVTLEPNLEDGLDPAPFSGSVAIEFTVLSPTKNITLHTRDLKVNESTLNLVDEQGTTPKIVNVTFDATTDFFIIHFLDDLLPRNYNLSIGSFSGTLHLDNGGFYLAKYQDGLGVERRFATTQFQSTNARRAFPCFDEPNLKATFLVDLVRKEGFRSISNEVLVSSTPLSGGRVKDSYKETVEMSTYLLAFVVTEYFSVSKGNQGVFARADAIKKGQATYALDTGLEIIQAMENFLGVNYTLGKLDQIAIPNDYFAPGAMENWGLVTYREGYLLTSPSSTSLEVQKTVTIIAHEFGHQWFGNLVTLDWWRYLWLNEGFATYFESFAASVVRPSWKLMDQFVTKNVHSAFDFDGRKNTEAMNYETAYPGGGAPSLISYQKAASVIRMMENFIGHEVFRRGLRNYLQHHNYNSTVPYDLYKSIQEVLDVSTASLPYTLEDIMTSWTEQKGYPVVQASMDSGVITLSQERFFLDYKTPKTSQTWIIPINIATSLEDFQDTKAEIWLTENNVTWTKPIQNCWGTFGNMETSKTKTTECPYIINKEQTSFYRVNYEMSNWQQLITLLNSDHSLVHVLNRAQLLDDSFALARSGRLSYEVPLSLAGYLIQETEYVPLQAFIFGVKHLNNILASRDDYHLFKDYIKWVLTPTMDSLGFQEDLIDTHLTKLNRVQLITLSCFVGQGDCLRNSSKSFEEWKISGKIPPPNLQEVVGCYGVRMGNKEDWDFLLEQYVLAKGNVSPDDVVRMRFLKGLGCSEDVAILNEFLRVIFDEGNVIRKDDKYLALNGIYNSGRFGLDFLFEFIEENFLSLKEKLDLKYLLGNMAQKFANEDYLNRLSKLSKEHPEAKDILQEAMETTRENLEWSNIFSPGIIQYLGEISEI